MENEFIPYTESLALKELGFDEPCFAYFKDEEFQYPNPYEPFKNSEMKSWCITAPLYSQAFRWFRDKYKLFPDFHKNELTDKYRYNEIKNTETYEVLYDSMDHYFNVEFDTYEEAELECLKKLIEIVKEK